MKLTQNERRSLPIWKKLFTVILTLIVFAMQIMLFVLMFQINFSNQLNLIPYLVIEGIGIVLVLHII
ncbi:MAG: hypothetical protein K2J93_01050, partial [Anaeroplasmataceae bacterium]|nr:hypothetical protein [Anaeroplasmataceae bacterium]